jgi:pyrroline-5-carboxylate reductase
VVGLFSRDADAEAQRELNNIFSALGFAMWMADEQKLNALGAVAGAGPAYAARFIDALAKAGVKRGLTPEIASTLAMETVFGTAWMAATNGESMVSVARRVASPNGTTEAGLAVLDRDGALDELVARTIDAAVARGAELADEAKGRSLAENVRLH